MHRHRQCVSVCQIGGLLRMPNKTWHNEAHPCTNDGGEAVLLFKLGCGSSSLYMHLRTTVGGGNGVKLGCDSGPPPTSVQTLGGRNKERLCCCNVELPSVQALPECKGGCLDLRGRPLNPRNHHNSANDSVLCAPRVDPCIGPGSLVGRRRAM